MILQPGNVIGFISGPTLKFDNWLFEKINQSWISPFLDRIMPFIYHGEIWYPFYLFLLVFALYNFRMKGYWWFATLIMTIIISDLVSSAGVKSFISRLRPCQNPDIMDQVRLMLNYCPTHSSFPASPACNHFAAAWFIFITLNQTGSWRWLLFLWALVVSYAQVYVGVHYPLDVAGGAVLGTAIGYGMSRFFRMQFGIVPSK
jgi:membrane-associated phospholipid phosphatase